MNKKLKILLVDDEQEFLNSISERVKIKGFEPVLANSGEEALKILESEKFHAAVIDLKMPGMDGLETIKQIRKIDPSLHTILLTGYGSEKVEEATGAMDSAYFEKGEMDNFWGYLRKVANKLENSMAAAGMATHGDLDDASNIEKGDSEKKKK